MFGVRQKAPRTLDAAVAATLELETYLLPRITTPQIAQVNEQYGGSDVIAAACYKKDGAQDLMSKLLERMERLEAKLSSVANGEESGSQGRSSWTPSLITCYNCREEGHIARNCPAKNQGNGRPSEQ